MTRSNVCFWPIAAAGPVIHSVAGNDPKRPECSLTFSGIRKMDLGASRPLCVASVLPASTMLSCARQIGHESI